MEETRKKVAIIDDNISFVDVLGRFLAMKNFEVVSAFDGTEGLKAVSRVMPDIILLDIMMPGLSGYEVCEKLKKVDKTKNIPVIFLTVRSRPEDIKKGYDLGAAFYITKPFNYPELIEGINKVLKEGGDKAKDILMGFLLNL
ncbi:MAG: response regulator [bacterium]|nr:response regulator [bacterium]